MNMISNSSLTDRFEKVFASSHSNLRGGLSEMFEYRTFMAKAMGSKMWDVDGKEYIDYLLAYGPNILGHQNPEIMSAMKNFIENMAPIGGSGAFSTVDDVEMGERMVKHIPCAEKIKLSVTGTDAVQIAIRLARAYTGRSKFIRFAGQYHGWGDSVIGGSLDKNPVGYPYAIEGDEEDVFYSEGKSPGVNEESFMLPYNDIEILEDVISKYGEEIALIHFEPIVTNHFCMMPKSGYLERVKELCQKNGIVMSFDEVITGFRLALGGVQEYLGITPDIATYGKALGGGVPVSAVAGNADIMKLFSEGRVIGAGTFNGFCLGTCVSAATLKILERDEGAIYGEIDRKTKRLEEGMAEIMKRRGIKTRIQGATGVFFTVFGVDPDRVIYTEEDLEDVDEDLGYSFHQDLRDQGIEMLADGRWFVSAALSDDDIDKTLEITDKIMAEF